MSHHSENGHVRQSGRSQPVTQACDPIERTWMARSKAQMTHAKRDRERARQEKRARKQEKKEARKLAASDPTADTEPATRSNGSDS